MTRKPDTTLVEETKAGDRDAFCELVRRYQDFAYGLAVALVADFDVAQDVVQEAFICAYCKLPKLREPERFGGWLRGIVRNTARRALRHREQDRMLFEKVCGIRAQLDAARSRIESPAAADCRILVQQALARLPRHNREAVTLHYVDGFSCADIAGFLGVTQATVKGRLQRGRRQLQEELRMIEDAFEKGKLPDEFAQEIAGIIDAWAERGVDLPDEIARLAAIGGPAFEPLREALDDPREAVSRGASHALCALGDERALEPMLAAWRADYAGVGCSVDLRRLLRARRVLAIPGARDTFLGLLREGDDDEREMAVQVLSQARGDREVFERVYEVFRTPGRLRRDALRALLEIDPDARGRVAGEAVASDDPRLQWLGAALALEHGVLLPIETCLQAFRRRVTSGRPDFVAWGRQAAGRLVLRHGEEGERVLRQLLVSGSREERATAAFALVEVAPQEAFDVLREEVLATPPDYAWTKAVAHALAVHCGEQLRAWVEREGGKLAATPGLVWVLAKSAETLPDEVTAAVLREGTPAARAAAVRLLARAKGTAALSELRELLREGRPRKVAQEAFRRMFAMGDAAHATAREMLASEHWTERKAAVALLRRWGKLSGEDAELASRDPHAAVRRAA